MAGQLQSNFAQTDRQAWAETDMWNRTTVTLIQVKQQHSLAVYSQTSEGIQTNADGFDEVKGYSIHSCAALLN